MERYQTLILTLFLSTTHGAPTCERSWVAYKDEICIKSYTNLETYDGANKFCSVLSDNFSKSSLVMVKGPDFQDFLTNYTEDIFEDVWLGGKYDAGESQFKWEDGEPLSYSNWQDGYPRNITGVDACIELRPPGSKTTTNITGIWAHVPCRKRNLVLCQKAPTWTLYATVKEILRIRKEHEEDRKQFEEKIEKQNEQLAKVSSMVVPVGSIYIEYFNQTSPLILWPNLNWEDITYTYAGLFFRAHGSGSENWGVTQPECAPRITKTHSMIRRGEPFAVSNPIPADGWSDFGYVGELFGADWYEGIRFYTQGCEVRPKNQAIRIWKRKE